jgi:hypothetical protein
MRYSKPGNGIAPVSRFVFPTYRLACCDRTLARQARIVKL